MEKLQTALENARKKRTRPARAAVPNGAKAPRAHRNTREKEEPGKPTPLDLLWDEIPMFQPSAQALIQNRIVTTQASKEAVPFDILRTKILLQMRQNGWNRLAITSPMASCGKTTTACNLAAGIGRQSNIRAILFDLDLRRPRIYRAFAHEPTHTLSAMLTGKVSFAEQALRLRKQVAVCMTSRPERDPTQLLLSETTEHLLDEIQAQYQPELMIFDLPPMLASDDTRAFLKNVDCALIVARADQTKYFQFDACEREISEHTNVLGTVLNACRFRGSEGEYEYSDY